jgi:hypothetical protein
MDLKGARPRVVTTLPLPQFFHDVLGRWKIQPELAALLHNVRFPPAVHAPPFVTLEAENAKPAVNRIVATLGAGAAAFVVFTLPRPTVLLAGSTASEVGTARG